MITLAIVSFYTYEHPEKIETIKSFFYESRQPEIKYEITESKKWKKWMIKNSNAKKLDKAIIAGHYIFSTPEFKKIKKNSERIIGKNVDKILKYEIKKSIWRYFELLDLS